MITCKRCNGSGLTGAGDEPWMHRGALTTCVDCKGTGTLPDEPNAQSESAQAPAEVPAEPKGFVGRTLEKIGL